MVRRGHSIMWFTMTDDVLLGKTTDYVTCSLKQLYPSWQAFNWQLSKLAGVQMAAIQIGRSPKNQNGIGIANTHCHDSTLVHITVFWHAVCGLALNWSLLRKGLTLFLDFIYKSSYLSRLVLILGQVVLKVVLIVHFMLAWAMGSEEGCSRYPPPTLVPIIFFIL